MHFTSSFAILSLLSAVPLTLAIPTLTRRDEYDGQSAGLIITTYNVAGCPMGTGQNLSYDVTYGKQVLANTLSYSLNRNIVEGEQLDWSTHTPNEGDINGVPGACTLFAETTSPDSNNHDLLEDLCYGLANQANCFQFWHH